MIDINNDKLFRTAFENSAIGMALVSPKGKWLKVNKAVCKIVGYTEEELLKISFQDITYKDDFKEDLNHVEQMLKGDIKTYQMEKRYVHKNNDIVWASLNVSLIRDESNEPQFFISEIIDITALKTANQKLEEKIEELEKINKSMIDREIKMVELKKQIEENK